MRKNGFTLIELLAVIVILAIIALIATPIVLNIISETKESAQLRSAEFYLDAVEQAIMRKNMSSVGMFKPSSCEVLDNGDLDCEGYADPIEVEVSGEVPEKGSILTIKDGKIDEITLKYGTDTIIKKDGKLDYDEPSELLYKIGQSIRFNPGDGIERDWNVIREDNDTVTLMLSENLEGTVEWYSLKNDTGYGPITAMTNLYNLTLDWTNVEPVNFNYTNDDTNNAVVYKSVTSNNKKVTIVDKLAVATNMELEKEIRARLLTMEEIFEIVQNLNPYLTKESLASYIERNIEEINLKFEISAKKVDDVINWYIQKENIQINEKNSYYIMYSIVLGSTLQGIDAKYEIGFPNFLIQNLKSGEMGYWTITTLKSDTVFSIIDFGGLGMMIDCDVYGKNLLGLNQKKSVIGLRPVITVLKSNL